VLVSEESRESSPFSDPVSLLYSTVVVTDDFDILTDDFDVMVDLDILETQVVKVLPLDINS
jgi:hypothetical protein